MRGQHFPIDMHRIHVGDDDIRRQVATVIQIDTRGLVAVQADPLDSGPQRYRDALFDHEPVQRIDEGTGAAHGETRHHVRVRDS